LIPGKRLEIARYVGQRVRDTYLEGVELRGSSMPRYVPRRRHAKEDTAAQTQENAYQQHLGFIRIGAEPNDDLTMMCLSL
jgi:hypothetical protein